MRCDLLLHILLQVLTFVKLAKRRWFWKLGNKLIGGPCTLLYNPCWHFLVKLFIVVFAPISSDDLIRMASVEISHSHLLQRSYIHHHTRVIQAIHHTTGAANVIFIWETNTKTWLRPKLGIEFSDWRMYNSPLFLRYKNRQVSSRISGLRFLPVHFLGCAHFFFLT